MRHSVSKNTVTKEHYGTPLGLRTLPRESFEIILQGTVLRNPNRIPSEENDRENGVVKGLWDQECERGNIAKQPPISYVPVTDEVQDALNINHKERLQKIKLPNSTEFNATIWYTGTPEEFANHVKQANHACDRMGLFEKYKKALADKNKASRLQSKAAGELATAQKEKLGDEIIKGFRMDMETHKKAAEEAEERRAQAAEGFFSLYANLLSIEARIAWDNIVE